MLGLNLRKEFQGQRLKGTSIELANENNTGATQVQAAEFRRTMTSLRWRWMVAPKFRWSNTRPTIACLAGRRMGGFCLRATAGARGMLG
jgi:hypothetical protein